MSGLGGSGARNKAESIKKNLDAIGTCAYNTTHRQPAGYGMATAKWAKKLTKKEMRHLADGSASGRPTIRSLRANLEGQRQLNIRCFECEAIARKLSIKVPEAIQEDRCSTKAT